MERNFILTRCRHYGVLQQRDTKGVAVSVLTMSGMLLVESSYSVLEKSKMPGRYLCSDMEEQLGCNQTTAKDSITDLLAVFFMRGISVELLRSQF